MQIMDTPRYDIYRGSQILGCILLLASIFTHTFWACAVAGLILMAVVVVDFYLITDFHAGLKAKDDILKDYISNVTHLKQTINETIKGYDILEENATDIIDELCPDESQRSELYQKLYKGIDKPE